MYEQVGGDAKLLTDGDQIRLVCLEETNQRSEKPRVACPRSKVVCVDSGQVEEALSPPRVAKRCCKRTKGNGDGVVWT